MFKNFISRAWNALCDFIIAVFMFIFVYNPVCFLLWSIFAPRIAANAATLHEFHRMEKMVKPIHYLYPLWIKKWFIKRYGLRNYSQNLQRKTFRAFQKKNASVACLADLFQTMSNETRSSVLYQSSATVQDAVLLSEVSLTAQDLQKLTLDRVLKYTKTNTLPVDYLIHLYAKYQVDAIERDSHKKEDWNCASGIILSHVEKYGVTKDFLDFVYAQRDPHFSTQVAKALKVFSEKQVVLKMQAYGGTNIGFFTAYIQSNGILETEAQKLLQPWQFEIFVRFYLPTDEAICCFLGKHDLKIAEILFKTQNIVFSNLALAIIKGNSELTMAYIRSGRHF